MRPGRRPVGLLLCVLVAALPGAIAAPVAAARGPLALTGPHTELVLDGSRTVRVHDPFLPSPAATPPAARRPKAPASSAPPPRARVARAPADVAGGPSVSAALSALHSAGAISDQQYSTWTGDYSAAQSSYGKLLGTRKLELGAVLTNVGQLAAAGQFTPTRLPALFLTLERNRQWWTTGALLSDGQRIGFSGSQLVWQYYAGQGIEIQWLGTFGKANGLWMSGNSNGALKSLLDEALGLAAQRAGGIAWEYLFHFDGGAPPWTSGLSQGTALQAYTRAWSRLHDAAYRTAAQQALGIFETAPPEGVDVPTPAGGGGAHYLEYSFAPGERILNGFIQALVGLYDYTKLTGDPLGSQLFAAGNAEAQVETPHYDTGAWSLYDQSVESDLSYHDLLRDFLANLCQRMGSPGQVYCTTAQHFTSYLHVAPVLRQLTTTGRARTAVRLRYSLSKISNVSVTVRRGATVVYSARGLSHYGTHWFVWHAPRVAGSYAVTLSATDRAGNSSSASGTVTLSKAKRP